MNHVNAPPPESGRRAFDSRYTVGTLVTSMGIGLAGIGVYAACAATLPGAGLIASFGLLTSGASLAVGALLGFLFGIPRSLQHDGQSAPPPAATASDATGVEGPGPGYRVNTNLEQISDWLTKILVGVGLTQLVTLPGLLKSTGEYLKTGFGGGAGSEAVALTVVLYFTTCGFLLGYLWTRLFLTGQFAESDLAAQAKEARTAAAKATERIQELESQSQADARALILAYQQLDTQEGISQVGQAELTEAIRAARPEMRSQIFYRAAGVRASTWNTDQALMEQTIPIFRALIAADDRDEFHLNHGQLGFALKDQRVPDWAEAERELSKAIELRGDWRTGGWLFYEFNRAVCRIELDDDFRQDRPSNPERREIILADLRVAANDQHIRGVILHDPTTSKWMRLNDVSEALLAG